MTRRLRAYRFIQRSIRSARRAGPDAYDEAAVQETLGQVGWLFGEGRYFGLDMRGLETLPPSPVMVVMNHSGGTTIPDVWGFGVAWYRHFGASRPLLVDFARDLMVMPGGDVETWRPYRDRYRLRWGNRMGYASLALSCGIPIVPVAHAGAHETLMVLDDGRRLARALGLRRFRAHIWPIHLSLPWGLAIGPWPHLPLPANLRYRVGRALNEHALPIEDPTPSQTAALDAEVRRALQSLLDELRYEADEKG